MIALDESTDTHIATHWDAIVIGAGPAGAISARQLALSGHRTLLVEAKHFPRRKACGGCLSARALAALRRVQLHEALRSCPSREIRSMEIWRRGRSLSVPLPTGLAIERATFDNELAMAARHAGAVTVFGTTASVLRDVQDALRTVVLAGRGGTSRQVTARVVLACDGLGHPSLTEIEEVDCRVSRHARRGVAATIEDERLAQSLADAAVRMVVGSSGYVGLAACTATHVNVAAAFDSPFLRRCGTPLAAINTTLGEAGVKNTLSDDASSWIGTRPLTQYSPQVARERLFLVGDATGYVEPFTGEGMTSAIQSAIIAADLADRAIVEWKDELATCWQARHDQFVRPSQTICSVLAWLSRHALAADVGFRMATCFPTIGEYAARYINYGNQRLGDMLI